MYTASNLLIKSQKRNISSTLNAHTHPKLDHQTTFRRRSGGRTIRLMLHAIAFTHFLQIGTFSRAYRRRRTRQGALVQHFARFHGQVPHAHLDPRVVRIEHRTQLALGFLLRHPSAGTRAVLRIPHCTLRRALRPHRRYLAQTDQRDARILQTKTFVRPDRVLVDGGGVDVHRLRSECAHES